MTRLPEIWVCLKLNMTIGLWTSLETIYEIVQSNLSLDTEDFQPQSPSSDIPKWKRNVRNVLQYRKKTGEIEWDGSAGYRI
jgi:hypothetical protein